MKPDQAIHQVYGQCRHHPVSSQQDAGCNMWDFIHTLCVYVLYVSERASEWVVLCVCMCVCLSICLANAPVKITSSHKCIRTFAAGSAFATAAAVCVCVSWFNQRISLSRGYTGTNSTALFPKDGWSFFFLAFFLSRFFPSAFATAGHLCALLNPPLLVVKSILSRFHFSNFLWQRIRCQGWFCIVHRESTMTKYKLHHLFPHPTLRVTRIESAVSIFVLEAGLLCQNSICNVHRW